MRSREKNRASSAAFFLAPQSRREKSHGRYRLSDRARPWRTYPHHALGDVYVSVQILRFTLRASYDYRLHQPPQPFRSFPRPDDLAMDHADTAPCEYAAPSWQDESEDEPE
jgi:hypothetical protein